MGKKREVSGGFMNPVLKIILVGWTLLLPVLVCADCEIDAANLYASFKKYREQLNSASRLTQLMPYFSTAFNRYYSDKLENSESEDNKAHYLTQYWNNLNTAKDIVIVYEYSVDCERAKDKNKTAGAAVLSLLVILDQPGVAALSTVDLWYVNVYYVNEAGLWLINSIEYTKSPSPRIYHEKQIIDNFAVVR